MPEIQKPSNLNLIWADAGDKIKPSDDKIQTGWLVEIPTRQNFNWLDGRQDQFNAHVNQRGIPQWDAETEYSGSKSLTMASNGDIYRCRVTHVNVEPQSDNGVYWQYIPLGVDNQDSLRRYLGYELYATNFTAQPNCRYYFTSPLTVQLPSNSSVGDVITMAKSPIVTATINASGNKIITSLGSFDSAVFDINDEINLVFNGTDWEV